MTYLPDITCVITSCNRMNLLRRTIESLKQYYDFAKWIVIEDGGADVTYLGTNFIVINNPKKLGQIRSIDLDYAHVQTPFVFHCEDDWEFYRDGFIEESMQILNRYPKILQVHLRQQSDMNGHPVISRPDLSFDLLSTNYKWKGFSFNPGLRRLKDYKNYTRICRNRPAPTSSPADEQRIGQYYYSMGFQTAILRQGAVRHIGGEHSTHKK